MQMRIILIIDSYSSRKAAQSMKELLMDTLLDTLKSIPILFLVYLLIEFLEVHAGPARIFSGKMEKFGPLAGALAGCIPQCGFSAAAASLYNEGMLSAGTLIAVFLSTSDEAIPVMLANLSDWRQILLLIGIKAAIAITAGYLLRWTVFRKEKPVGAAVSQKENHKHNSLLFCVFRRTAQITVFIGIISLIINLTVFIIGEENLNHILLTNSPFQPLLTALIGLVPGCAVSVLLTEFFLNGTISFGAAVAGLSTGAGFGYLVLLRGGSQRKATLKIILWTYLAAALAGTAIHLIMM